MPPKATTTDLNGTKFVPADCVSVLLMALGNTTITKQQLNMMSALDGTRTASSFEHQFRSIIAKAKDLKARVDDGEEFTLVPSGKKRGETTPKATAPKTPSKKRKNASSDDDFDGTPSKKKSTPKSAKKQQPQKLVDNSHLDEDFPKDSFDFIKNENKWEEEFA